MSDQVEPAAAPKFSIEGLRNLVTSLPVVSKEVALKVAEQLPELRKIADRALQQLETMHKNSTDANQQSQKRVHDAYRDVRRILKNELDVDELTFEQRKEIYDRLIDTADKDAAKDTENKRLLDAWLKAGGVVALAALAVIVVMLGGKGSIDKV